MNKITGIEQNYQYGNYGQGSKIGVLGGITTAYPRAAAPEQGGTLNGRFLDNAPLLTRIEYAEDLKAQAGYGSGKSSVSWIG